MSESAGLALVPEHTREAHGLSEYIREMGRTLTRQRDNIYGLEYMN